MIDYQKVIDYYYPEETMPELREILVKHSRYVAELAAKVCEAHPDGHTLPWDGTLLVSWCDRCTDDTGGRYA